VKHLSQYIVVCVWYTGAVSEIPLTSVVCCYDVFSVEGRQSEPRWKKLSYLLSVATSRYSTDGR